MQNVNRISSLIYKCKICEITVCNAGQLKKHLAGHERNSCNICGTSFSTKKLLDSHLLDIHNARAENKSFVCSFCGRCFAQKRSLYHHYKLKHTEKGNVCTVCGEFLQSIEAYNKHVAEHEAKLISCHLCETKFKRMQQYILHIKEHNKYQCLTCNISYACKELALKHERTGHNVSGLGLNYSCEHCHSFFSSFESLQKHEQSHRDKQYFCESCKLSFMRERNYQQHLSSHAHRENLEGIQKCSECNKCFGNKRLLEIHVNRKHIQHSILHCTDCNYSTDIIYNLKRHMRIHTNEYEFICDKCPKFFHTKTALKDHISCVHSKIQRYICEKCARRFKLLNDLTRHMKVHTEEKQVVCKCGRAYKFMSSFRRHERKCNLQPNNEIVDEAISTSEIINNEKCADLDESFFTLPSDDNVEWANLADLNDSSDCISTIHNNEPGLIGEVQTTEGLLQQLVGDDSFINDTLDLNPPIETSLVTSLEDISELPIQSDMVNSIQQSITAELSDCYSSTFFII